MKLVAACVALFAACGSAGDAVLVGPRFVGVDGQDNVVAVRVDERGRVVSFHTSYPADGHLVNVPGRFAYVGLGDAHVHLSWIARRADTLDLAGKTSPAAVRAALEAHAKAHPAPAVVVGDNWDQTLWTPADMPRASDLGTAITRPVVLNRVDGHVIWLNDVALQSVADYLATDHAPPEKIVRDADGHATGVIVDPHPELSARLLPAPSEADLGRWIRAGMEQCADAGLVEVHDMATSPAELAVLLKLADEPWPVRVVVYVDNSEASFTWLRDHPAPFVKGDLEVRGVKLFADGALGSRGAALKAPYSDHASSGQATPLVELAAQAARAAGFGYQVAIHAIGDLGVANALSALEGAKAASKGSFRGRVEHAQVIDLDKDLSRFVAGGFVASMQPTHATSDMRWAEARLGPERVKGAYAWRAVLDAKVPLAFGSDAPIESFDPRAAIWAATRRGDWQMQQAVTFAEAIAALSQGVAFAAGAERERGANARGQLLQLSVFDKLLSDDPRAAHAQSTVRGLRVRPIAQR